MVRRALEGTLCVIALAFCACEKTEGAEQPTELASTGGTPIAASGGSAGESGAGGIGQGGAGTGGTSSGGTSSGGANPETGGSGGSSGAGSGGGTSSGGNGGSGGTVNDGGPSNGGGDAETDAGAMVDAGAVPTMLRLVEAPPPETQPAPHVDDCTFPASQDLVAANVLTPPATEVEIDDTYVYFTQRAQVLCVPGGCQQQGTVLRVPRCGGIPIALGAALSGTVSIRAGGGKVYALSSQSGLFRLDGATGASQKLDVTASCVAGFAANATSVVVADGCDGRLLRASHTDASLANWKTVASPSLVALSEKTAYVATPNGVEWVTLATGSTGMLTAYAPDLLNLGADATALWLLYYDAGQLRVGRLPLDGSAPEAFPSAALNGVPTIAVADGYGYFLSYTPPADKGAVARAPSGGGPVEILRSSVVYTDVAAYGNRAYFTEQGAVRTAP